LAGALLRSLHRYKFGSDDPPERRLGEMIARQIATVD